MNEELHAPVQTHRARRQKEKGKLGETETEVGRDSACEDIVFLAKGPAGFG